MTDPTESERLREALNAGKDPHIVALAAYEDGYSDGYDAALAAPDPSLLAAVEASPPEAVWSQTDRMYGWTVAFQHLRAASSREAGLDAERLAEAVANILDVTTHDRLAPYLPRIAAEYDRLATSPDPAE